MQDVVQSLVEASPDHSRTPDREVLKRRYQDLVKYWFYLSYQDFAEIWDVSVPTVYYWANNVKEETGWEKSDIYRFTLDDRSKRIRAWCQELDFDLDLAVERANQDWDAEHIFQEAVRPKTYRCDEYVPSIRTLGDWAEASDLKYQTLYQRLQRGTILKDSLEIEEKGSSLKTILGLKVSTWSDVLPFSPHLLYNRLSRDWSDLEVLTTPKRGTDQTEQELRTLLVSAGVKNQDINDALIDSDFFESDVESTEEVYDFYVDSSTEFETPGESLLTKLKGLWNSIKLLFRMEKQEK